MRLCAGASARRESAKGELEIRLVTSAILDGRTGTVRRPARSVMGPTRSSLSTLMVVVLVLAVNLAAGGPFYAHSPVVTVGQVVVKVRNASGATAANGPIAINYVLI